MTYIKQRLADELYPRLYEGLQALMDASHICELYGEHSLMEDLDQIVVEVGRIKSSVVMQRRPTRQLRIDSPKA